MLNKIEAEFQGMILPVSDKKLMVKPNPEATYRVIIEPLMGGKTCRYLARMVGAGRIGTAASEIALKKLVEPMFEKKIVDWA